MRRKARRAEEEVNRMRKREKEVKRGGGEDGEGYENGERKGGEG